jgi:DNA-binding MarR family transcriptional regulator
MDPYKFILDKVDTVPHLEALMLLWNSRPVGWTCAELGSRLYIPSDRVGDLLRDLVRMQLIIESSTETLRYSYVSKTPEQDELMRAVDAAHRQDLVRISTMIHAKTSPAVREFARAFLFKKSDDQ